MFYVKLNDFMCDFIKCSCEMCLKKYYEMATSSISHAEIRKS